MNSRGAGIGLLLLSAAAFRSGLYADSLGHATLSDLHDRQVRLEIMRSNTYTAHGPVTLRTGYRDTLRITLAEMLLCGTVSN